MADTSRVDAAALREEASHWPWSCLRCDATVYTDVRYCTDCAAHEARRRRGTHGDGNGSFREWIRSQSYPSFVTTVASIASVELALTALWLQIMLVGPANLLPPGL